MKWRSALGPIAVLGSLFLGTRIGERLGPSSAVWMLVAACGCLGIAVMVGNARRLVLAMVGFGLLGTATMARSLNGLTDTPLVALAAAGREVSVTVTLLDDPGGGRYQSEVPAAMSVLRFDSIDVGPTDADSTVGTDSLLRGPIEVGRTVLLSASGSAAGGLRLLEAGDRVELSGRLEPLADRWARWRWKHAVARLVVDELSGFSASRSVLFRTANATRALILRGHRGLASNERSLIAGFLLGDTRQVDFEVISNFRTAGMTHLLAVSGANVAFVLALLRPGLERFGLWTRCVGGLTTLVLFGVMTRWEPSVLRAVVMAGCALLAQTLGRPQSAARVLVVAVIALIVVDPFLVHSVGFGLSVGATAGIAVFGTTLVERIRGPRWFRECLGVTLAAQMGVTPLLLAVFGSVSLVSIPANLFAVPLVGPLTMWGLIGGVSGGVIESFWPAASEALQIPTAVMLRAVQGIAALCARFPVAVDARGIWATFAIGCLFGAVRNTRLRRQAPA